MKVAFRLITQPDALWAQFLRAKYKITVPVPSSIRGRNYSSLWKGISMVWHDVYHNIIWRVGHCRSIDFWWDPWVPKIGALYLHILPQFANPPKGVSVADMATMEGEWRWEVLQQLMPRYVLLRIDAIKALCPVIETNVIDWGGSSSGRFAIHDAYLLHRGIRALARSRDVGIKRVRDRSRRSGER
ncbi:hypothetical protein V6N13_081208 [Hibiscus sabdariffa]